MGNTEYKFKLRSGWNSLNNATLQLVSLQHCRLASSTVSHESCLLDQVLDLIMSESQTHSNSLFLNEDASKCRIPESRVQRFQKAMQKQATRAQKRMSSITRESVRNFLKRNAFVLLTVAAVVLGIILGFGLRRYDMSLREIKYFSFPGELLMRMLQMLVLPLIVSSLVSGMSSLDSRASGKMGVRAVVYYMVTTFIAVFIGIVMVMIIRPGKGHRDSSVPTESKIEQIQAVDAFLDLIRNMFPPNLVEACFKQYKTQYIKRLVKRNVRTAVNFTDATNATESPILANVTQAIQTMQETITMEEAVPGPGSSNGVNALGLVAFSMCFGLVIGKMKQKGQALLEFFDCLNEAIMRLVAIIIW
ncbi:excitatory amino acid transporter 4 isoform X4 [Acipenser ruthenus]|nr:excitatory amino acid transporter 4 isoform X4 [Acipenser ruthenus]